MSIIPNDRLESADSLTLQVYGIEMLINSAIQKIDMYTRHKGFWKSCIIRNTQPIDFLQYRTDPTAPFKIVQPNSELPIKGWGSFMEVTSAAATPLGIVEFEVVNMLEAMRKQDA